MQDMTINNIPEDIFQHILSFTNHWDLINASYVSKGWRAKLTSTFNQMHEIYVTLIEQSAEAIVEACLQSTRATQATFMASKLLRKLTIEQVVIISGSSYEHAEIVFRSKLFHGKPKQSLLNQDKDISSNFSTLFNELLHLDFSPDIFDHFIPSTFSDLSSQIKKLTRTDLLSEELSRLEEEFLKYEAKGISISSNITNKFACQAYIARAIAEKDPIYIELVDVYASQTLNPYRIKIISELSLEHANTILNTRAAKRILKGHQIISIAKLSPSHAKIILNTSALKSKLSTQVMVEIISINAEYKSIVVAYAINLMCALPVQLAKAKTQMVKAIVLLLVKDTFFNPSTNPIWKNWLEKKFELSQHILEVKKIFNHQAAVSCILLKLIELSVEHAKEVLSIPKIEKFLDNNGLKLLASKNSDYNLLISNFLSQEESNLSKSFNI